MNGMEITPRTLTGMCLQSLDPDLKQLLALTDKRADSLQPRHPALEHATEAPGRRRLRHKLPHLLLNLHARNAEILLKYLPVMSQGPAIHCSTLIVAAVPNKYTSNTQPLCPNAPIIRGPTVHVAAKVLRLQRHKAKRLVAPQLRYHLLAPCALDVSASLT